MAREQSRRNDLPVRVPVDGGDFVTSRQPGHFTDPLTGIKIFGPKAIVDEITREVVEFTDIPDPVQLPTFKMSPDAKDRSEWNAIGFFDADDLNVHDAIWLAVQTGILEVVPDEVVKASFPAAWAARREWTYEPRSDARAAVKAESLLDLYERARDEHMRTAREAHRGADADAKAAAVR